MDASTAAAATPPPSDVAANTMAEAFRNTVARAGDQVGIKSLDGSVSLTWNQVAERSDALAGGLAKLGVTKGENVALMFGNRPEFHLADLAVMTLGACPFSMYQTSSPEQIQYLLTDSEARIAIIEQAHLDQVAGARELGVPTLETIIVLEGAEGEGMMSWDDVEGSDPDFDPKPYLAEIGAEDPLTLIYTSGTTGPPKGVELVHRNLMAAVMAVRDVVSFDDGVRVVSWLPNAHIAERAAHHYIPITYAGEITTNPDPRRVIQDALPAVRPQWFFAVPRIWEKLKAGLEAMIASQPEEQRTQAQATLDAAIEKVRLEQKGEPVPDELAATVKAADENMFVHLRKHLGLDQILAVNVGAAPTPREVLEFFHAIGIPVSELWGMSETCGAGCVNPPGKIKIGTVGPPAPGVEIKIAEDGEVLMRADVVMKGYRNQPDKTAETIDADGWLHTGDIGVLDEDNYLTIVDRKKELIINAAGKNMSPANIESTLKASSPLIGQACCIGDARSYNTALIVLDADFAPGWAKQNGLSEELEALADEDAMREAIQQGVDAANAKLARVEQIKKFTIVRGDWAPGGDELTPTMKLKRKPIAAKYSDAIEAMYAK